MNLLARRACAALAFLLAPAAAFAAPQLILACQTLSQPGSYVLFRNLSATGDCLVVASNYVTIDLAGFVVSGGGAGAGIREAAGTPFPGFRGVIVRNGSVTGFSDGLSFFNSTGVTVERVNSSFNANNGMTLGQRAMVSESRADENGGIGISAGIGSSLRANTVGRNHGSGIVADEGAIVVNNEARNNGLDGIFMDCPGAAVANTAGNNLGQNLVTLNGSCVADHNSTL